MWSGKQTTRIQSNTTQVNVYMYGTFFSLYLGYHQAFQYKNHTMEDTVKM